MSDMRNGDTVSDDEYRSRPVCGPVLQELISEFRAAASYGYDDSYSSEHDTEEVIRAALDELGLQEPPVGMAAGGSDVG